MVGCEVCPGEGRTVKIALSVGVVALVVFGALLVVVGQRVAPRIERSLGIGVESAEREFKEVSYDDGRNGPTNSLPVNEAARREVKRQAINAGNFMQSVPSSIRRSGNKMFPLASQETYCIDCVPVAQVGSPQIGSPQVTNRQPSMPVPAPSSPQAGSSFSAKPAGEKYSISLFVGTGAPSNKLLEWWNNDAKLQALRKQMDFNTYTKDNGQYKARFANTVPVEAFPAVVITAPDGGHVYYSTNTELEGSAEAHYSAIYDAFQVYQQLHERQAAEPIQQQSAEDCPDGNCTPRNPSPFLNPERERLFPLLRPKPSNPAENILYWLWNPGEAMLMVLCGFLILAIVGVVLLKLLRARE